VPVRLVGVPWDATTLGRKGARLAPSAIRHELGRLHPFDARSGRPVAWLAGKDLTLSEDHGDLLRSVSRAAEQGAKLDPDAPLVLLGGDHAVAFAGASALHRRFPDLEVVSLDAHLDLRDLHGGPTNGNWATRWIEEAPGKLRVWGLGRFANGAALFELAKERRVEWVPSWAIRENGTGKAVGASLATMRGKDVYLTLDIDSLDQASAPGASSPAPDGISVAEATELLSLVQRNARVRGFDICEVNPTVDPAGITPRLAAHLLLAFLSGTAPGSGGS
jgi:formimidoylglutamase